MIVICRYSLDIIPIPGKLREYHPTIAEALRIEETLNGVMSIPD